jgi:hypothetical protein
MAAIVQAQCNKLIDTTLVTAAPTLAVTGVKVRLTTTAPTNTTAGTELSGTGYTASGTVTTWNSASAGSTTNITVLSWTNSSGSGWSIVGGEVWDEAGTPIRWWFWSWTGQPISIANGNTFSVAAAGITLTLT